MYALSKQYREIGYINYGSFRQINSLTPQIGIILVPFIGSVLTFLIQMRMTFKSFQTADERLPLCFLLVVLLLVLSVRTALIVIQGYALIFI